MKIINAVWEKRNFGCDAYEIYLDKKDLKNTPEKILEEIYSQNFLNAYVTIKVPVGNLHLVHALEDDGFRFMETQMYLKEYFDPLMPSEQIKGLMESLGLKRIIVEKTREAWGRIIEKIIPGMFSTDRVSLDPYLGEDVACIRYKNWSWDLFEKPNSRMWLLLAEDREISFGINIYDEKTGVENGILGGVFPEYQGEGYGIFQILGATRSAKNNRTVVSSNNFSMLRIYQHYGMILYKECYVLRKLYSKRDK